jgi:hypothetical protein
MAEWRLFLGQLFDVIGRVGGVVAITRWDLSRRRQPRYVLGREAEHKRRASLETRE